MRVLFAGTSSDVGKTTIVLGIMRALRNRGMKVQGFKAGPDYIDTAFHTFATDIPSRNLDTWMMTPDVIRALLGLQADTSDISIMEGVMGMFDGADVHTIEGSSAHLAKLTNTPVILIINGSGVALSAAAMVKGFVSFDKSVAIKGVIVNKVGSEGHYKLIKEAIEYHVGIPCLGYLKKNENIQLKSRHLGLIPSVEVNALDEKINEVAEMVETTIDLDAVLKVARSAEVLNSQPLKIQPQRVRLAVARDRAFNFYYQDNLDYLKALGCELVFFSPLTDHSLPKDIHGLYIGGGFPEVFAKELEQNNTMRSSIQEAVKQGLPTYAECGGLMYLTAYIETLEQQQYTMCGIFENGSKMTKRLQHFGYVQVTLTQETVIGPKGLQVKGHEFHRSMVVEDPNDLSPYHRYDVKKTKNQADKWKGAYSKYNCLGAYPHIHFYSNQSIAKHFVANCEAFKRGEKHEE